MKVLLVHNRYRSAAPSGEDRVVDQEAEALAAAGHRVEKFERCSDEIAASSAARRALVPGRVVWSEEGRRTLAATLQRVRPDVVHVHNLFPLLSPSVLYACRGAGVPVVVTVHNYRLICPSGELFRDGHVCHDCLGRTPHPGVRHGCYRRSALATLPIAVGMVAHHAAWRSLPSAYIFLSNAQRGIFAAEGFPVDRLFVKPNFVPLRPAPVVDRDNVVVYAGRLSDLKGVPLLMEAWDRYSAAAAAAAGGGGSGLRLMIAGAGPLEDRVATWSAQRPSVEWLGALSRADCGSLVERARAVVVPSQWEETFGLIVIEAMAAGVPAVASARGSFPEIVDDGVDGSLFEPGSAAALAGVFGDIDARPDRYRALGEAARRTYERRFTDRVNVAQLLDIYRFAIDHPASPVPEPARSPGPA